MSLQELAQKRIQEKKKEIDEVLAYFDRDYDKTIKVQDLGKVIRSCGFAPTEKQIEDIKQKVQGEKMSFDQYFKELEIYLTNSVELTKSPEQRLAEAFKVLDREKKGFVKVSELRHVLTTVGEKLSKDEVDEMFERSGIQRGEEKDLTFEEFKSVFLFTKPQ